MPTCRRRFPSAGRHNRPARCKARCPWSPRPADGRSSRAFLRLRWSPRSSVSFFLQSRGNVPAGEPDAAVQETTVDVAAHAAAGCGARAAASQEYTRCARTRAVAVAAGARAFAPGVGRRASHANRQPARANDAERCRHSCERTRARKNTARAARPGARIVYDSSSARRLRGRRTHASTHVAAAGRFQPRSICARRPRLRRRAAGPRKSRGPAG